MDSEYTSEREDNYEDLQGQEAISRIKEMVEQAKNCFFCAAVMIARARRNFMAAEQ